MDNNRINQIRVRQQQCAPLIPQLGLGTHMSLLVNNDLSWLISTLSAQHGEIMKMNEQRDRLMADIVWLQQERARLLAMTTFEDQSYDLGSTVLLSRKLTAKVRGIEPVSAEI